MYSTTASVALVFVIGAVGVWGPQYVVLSRRVLFEDEHTFEEYRIHFTLLAFSFLCHITCKLWS